MYSLGDAIRAMSRWFDKCYKIVSVHQKIALYILYVKMAHAGDVAALFLVVAVSGGQTSSQRRGGPLPKQMASV